MECLLRANSGHWAGARLAVKFCSRNCTSGRISKAIAQAYTRRQHVHKIERLNILIPTDGSELAEHGVTNGLLLAKSVGARVTAIIIEEPFNWLSVSETQAQRALEELAKHAEQIKKHAASVLNRVANAAKQAGVPCDTIQVETRNHIKPSLQQPRTGAAISSSWHRTVAADYPQLCSAVSQIRC